MKDICVDDFSNFISNFIPFSFTKINHGFWERILDKTNSKSPFAYSKEVYLEIYKICQSLPLDHFYFGIDDAGTSLIPPNYSLENTRIQSIDKIDKKRIGDIRRIIAKFLPKHVIPYNGQIFRYLAAENKLVDFFALFKHNIVVTVGGKHLANLGTILNYNNHIHLSLHPTNAWFFRIKTLEILRQKLINLSHPIILFQGSYTATWIIYKLHLYNKYILLDLGRALDVFYPHVQNQAWFYLLNLERFYRRYW